MFKSFRLQSPSDNKLVFLIEFHYTNSMKNKAYQYADMTEDERSMTLFYTIEGMVESLQIIGNELETEQPNGCQRLAQLTDLSDMIENLYDRVHKTYIENKTKNAITYSI